MLLVVSPEEPGIEEVGMDLVQVSIEFVEALFVRNARGAVVSQAPFAENTCGVAGLLEHFGDRDVLRQYRRAAAVDPHRSVARVPSCHEHAPRWCTNTVACIDLCELRSLGSHPIQIRCADFLLAVAAEMAVTQIISHDEDNVRLVRGCST